MQFVRDSTRIYETIGCKPHFTQFIVSRGALGNSVMSFTLKLISGKLGPKSYSREILLHFRPTKESSTVNRLHLDKGRDG